MRPERQPVNEAQQEFEQFMNFVFNRVLFKCRELASLGESKYSVNKQSFSMNETSATVEINGKLVGVSLSNKVWDVTVGGVSVSTGTTAGDNVGEGAAIFSLLEPHL